MKDGQDRREAVDAGRVFRIAVSVEHVRAWGRQVCEGIARYVGQNASCSIDLFEDGFARDADISRYDGFLCCITTRECADRLVATGRPVIDLLTDVAHPQTVHVGSSHVHCGRLAAQHLLARHFRKFAFCGWDGLRFSQSREKAFAEELARKGFDCHVYRSPRTSIRQYVGRFVLRERLELPADFQKIGAWLCRLPKPVAIFCANDMRAWQVNEICRRHAMRVPEDVAVLGADNDSIPCLLTTPSISSVDAGMSEIGYQAAATLGAILDGKRSATDFSEVLILPREVENRGSTAIFPVEPPYLAAALSYIHSHVEKGILASDVIRYVGISYQKLAVAFRDKLGTTVQKEIMESRLDCAEHLLRSTSMPLKEVAAVSGFKTQQYFSSCFRTKYAVTPGEWRMGKTSANNIL